MARTYTDEELELMTQLREKAADIGVIMDELAKLPTVDKRWHAIAKTNLQQGFMAADRAVTQPTTF